MQAYDPTYAFGGLGALTTAQHDQIDEMLETVRLSLSAAHRELGEARLPSRAVAEAFASRLDAVQTGYDVSQAALTTEEVGSHGEMVSELRGELEALQALRAEISEVRLPAANEPSAWVGVGDSIFVVGVAAAIFAGTIKG